MSTFPAFPTVLLLLIAGFCLQSAVNHLVAWFGKRRNVMSGLFGLLCVLGAAYALLTAATYHASQYRQFLYWSKWQIESIRLLVACIPWFIAYYAGIKPGWREKALAFVFLGLGAMDLFCSDMIFYSRITGFHVAENPWGGPSPEVVGSMGWAGYALYLAYLGLLLYSSTAVWSLYRRGNRKKSAALFFVLLICVWAYAQDLLIDTGLMRGSNLSTFAIFNFLLLVGFDLGVQRIRAETNYQTLFDSINDAIFVHDGRTYAILDVNEAACRMYGVPRDIILRNVIRPAVGPEGEFSMDKAKQMLQKAQTEGPQIFEWLTVRADGNPLWVEMSLRAAEIDGREVVLATVRDIRDRKRDQAELAESEARYRAIVDGFDGMIYICSPDKKLRFLNIPMQEYLGRNAVGESCQEAFGAAGPSEPWCAGQISKFGSLHRESHDPKTGRWYDVSITPIPHSDGTFSRLVLLRDVTDRKRSQEKRQQLEGRIRQSEKLESLGVLAGGTAHDLNNLLTAILGNADLALADVEEGSPPALSLGRLKGAARRAAELAKQLLAYSGRGRFQRISVSLNEAVREVVDLLQATLPTRIQIHLDLDDGNPTLMGDPTQVRQIILNLVTNAVESFGEGGGPLQISTKVEDPPGGAPGVLHEFFEWSDQVETVLLEVTDQGCGMDSETQNRIFEPFFSTKFAGRGLGMAAVLGIVRGHRGAIEMVSSPGQGTKVRVYLPGYASMQKRNTSPTEKRRERPQGRILVVDDEELVRDAVAGMLKSIGWKVDQAADGSKALEQLRSPGEKPDIVLLDLTMPRLDGRQTAKLIREISPELPIILMSGAFSRPEDDPEGLSGTDAFLPKPFSVADLKNCLTRFPVGKS